MASPNPNPYPQPKNRYAVLVGCTYGGAIYGSSNNVALMSDTLRTRFSFSQNNITVLVENNDGGKQPTCENIKIAIANWIHHAVPEDVICFYFSGRCDPANQLIETSDSQNISDQYFTDEVLAKLPARASFTMVVDASYCGDLIDKPRQPTANPQVAAAGGIGILLSGCGPREIANEYNVDGKVYGAFTYALRQVLDEHPRSITNRELIGQATTKVASEGFPQQHPCLYCDDSDANAPFLFKK